LLNDFKPEDDPTTIDGLMNWLGATSDQSQEIMDALMEFYMSFMGWDDEYWDEMEEMDPPTYDDVSAFFGDLNNELNVQLNFDDNVYNYLMNDFMPEDDPTTIDGLMNMLGATTDMQDQIMDALKDWYMEFYGFGDEDDNKPDFDWLQGWFANRNLQYT